MMSMQQMTEEQERYETEKWEKHRKQQKELKVIINELKQEIPWMKVRKENVINS